MGQQPGNPEGTELRPADKAGPPVPVPTSITTGGQAGVSSGVPAGASGRAQGDAGGRTLPPRRADAAARGGAKAARTAPEAPGNRYRAALRRLVPAFAGVLGFSAVLNVLMLTGSLYMLQVYDRVLTSGSVPTLMALFAIVVVLYAFLGYYDFLRARMMSRAALRLDRDCGADAFRLWIRSESTEITPPLRDLESVRGYLSSPAVGALYDLPFVPLFLGVLFLVHPALGWLTVGGALVIGALAFLNHRLTREALNRAGGLESIDRGFAEQSRRAAETVRAMRMDDSVADRWSALHDQALASAQAGGAPSEVLAASSRAFRMLLQSAILTLGAYLVLKGEISGGMIIASSILSGRALAPVDQLIGQWRLLGRARAAHRRLIALFDQPAPTPTALALPEPTGAISLLRATVFAPSAAANRDKAADDETGALLKQIDLDLAPGDGLGVIGRSASGKSTLARLLVGAISPGRGEIRYDGATPDQWDPLRLGRAIGYLPQQVDMLPGTLRDNIARFDPDLADEAVIEAARQTGIHEMILRLPEGYATRLDGPGAPRLSGGQLQRLALARAICGKPKIVVLDEPNSNLDPAGETALIGVIAALRREGTTVVVMAHRPSAIAAVDKLLVLDNGRVQAFGDKDEVLARMTGRVPPGNAHLRPIAAGGAPANDAEAAPAKPPARPTTGAQARARIIRQTGPGKVSR